MEEKRVKFVCSLDCFDGCTMIATVRNGKVIKIEADKEHPMTRGFFCEKGRKHLERLYHPQRIYRPRKKETGIWKDITWEEALDEISEKLLDIKEKYGSTAVMYFNDAGYGGLNKMVDEMFFNYYGGVTVPRGNLCWGAGIKAQEYDFGAVRGHHPKDHLNAKNIIIWGRNPYNTNIHLMQYLKEAKNKGTRIILIDPIKTKTASIADEHISIRPSTDGALALGMSNIIITKDLIDQRFIEQCVLGYRQFKEYVKEFTPERVEEITGVDKNIIERLAITYGSEKPSCIILGYGLQRYSNGGNNIRCIDALGAITGNIGISGGGVNYANNLISQYIKGEVDKSVLYASNVRSYSKTQVGEFLMTADNPPIKCLFVMKSNPLVQVPDIHKTLQAFKKVEFKVVIDMFMTDTARLADIVLPCTSIMEEEDIVYSSMFTPYLNYSHKVVEPPEGMIGEYELFRLLARKMQLKDYPDITKEDFLRRAIAPLKEEFGITLEDLKKTHFAIPHREIPWADRKFSTPSGKFELYSKLAEKDGLSPLPQYIQPMLGEKEFPLRLITPHSKNSLHSQHFAFVDEIPTVYLNSYTSKKYGLMHAKKAIITSKKGTLVVKVKEDNCISDDILVIYEGWWHKSGSVNFLTETIHADMGEQAAYYDCFCKIRYFEE